MLTRFKALGAYFESLAEGDPVAIGFTLLFVVIAGVIGLVAWRSKVQMRREDEARKNKWKKKKA